MKRSRIGALVTHAMRHARAPRSLPHVLWKNLRLAYVSRSPAHWNEQGRGFAARGRHEEALECYDRGLAIKGDIAQLWANRGRALKSLCRLEEAEASLREALRRQPDFVNAHCELAGVLDYLGRFQDAEASARSALRVQPDHAYSHFRLGRILCRLGHAHEAQASFRTALRLQPDVPEWHWALAQALLLAGEFQEGWREFEWRWRIERMRPGFSAPSWTGEPADDRVILLLADQGHGDTLQFCRYVPHIAADARKVVLAVQPALVRLLSRLPGASDVVPHQGRLPSFDVWCALMRLPHVLGTRLETLPSPTPYLAADPQDVVRWRERLGDLTGLRVGLCWAGAPGRGLGEIAWDRRRSITLDVLAPLGGIPKVRFVSLQKGPSATEAARPPQGLELHDFTDDLHDFADTAALVENLDLIISVDTAVVHVAGALGKPVWLLNRFDTCWRWLLDREDSPWYPTLRQFRQPTPGDWPSVIGRVGDALRRLAEGDRSQLRLPAA